MNHQSSLSRTSDPPEMKPPTLRNKGSVRQCGNHSKRTPTTAEDPKMLLSSSRPSDLPSPSSIPPRTYQPYQNSTLETPAFHLLLRSLCLPFLRPVLAIVYKIRWMLSYPMTVPIVPRLFRRSTHTIPTSVWLTHLTIGDLSLFLPLVIITLLCYHHTFVVANWKENGKMASYALYLTFLTASKSNSLFSFLFGISFERMIPLHYLSSLVAIACGCMHLYVVFVYGGDRDGNSKYVQFGDEPNLWRFLWDTDTNLSGALIMAFMILSVSISFFPIVRRVCFKLWYFAHILLGVGTILALFYHDVRSVLFVTVWWGLDLLARYGIMAGVRNRTKGTIRLIGNTPEQQAHEPAIEITFPKASINFEHNAGQFVQLAIPKLSIFEFHPFTISSAPHEELVTFHIRELGDWTRRLVELAAQCSETEIWIEGPYGSLQIDIEDDERYRMVLLIGGGIGVTPCQSIGKMLLHQHLAFGRHLKAMRMIWAVRDTKMVNEIPPLFGDDYSENSPQWNSPTYRSSNGGTNPSIDASSSQPAMVQIDVYCTQTKQDPEQDSANLLYNVHYGRPNLDEIFLSMKAQAIKMKECNVAVIGCGPEALMSTIHEACRMHSASVLSCGDEPQVFFDLHREFFAF